jgi:hypothetical protein
MPRLEHLPKGAQAQARLRHWSDARVDQLVADFFRAYPKFFENPAGLSESLSEHFQQEAVAEFEREARISVSLMLEWSGPSKFRAIVFETDWQDYSHVRDIAEADKLSDLKRWFLKSYPEVRCVFLGGSEKLREVHDVFLTASCLMRKTYEESDVDTEAGH